MKILILILFSSSVFAFDQLNERFDGSQVLKVVELPLSIEGQCQSILGQEHSIRLIMAFKKEEQDQGSGFPRVVREYRFGLYSSEIPGFRARKLLIERDWANLQAHKGMDDAVTLMSVEDVPRFKYEARRSGNQILIQVRSQVEGPIRIGGEEFAAAVEQPVLVCQFPGAQ